MKKYVFIIFLFSAVLTGCFGNAGSGELESTCTKVIDSQVLKETDTYIISYKEGNIKNTILKKEYTGMDISASLKTYQKTYESSNGVDINIENNTFTATFDISNVDDEIMNTCNLKKTYNEQVKTLKDLGFTCE